MEWTRRVEKIPRGLPSPRVAIGTFDGLHRGHRAVIGEVRTLTGSAGGSAVVVTFEPYPQEVLAPARPTARLTTLGEKRVLLEAAGVDVMVALPFSRQMAAMEAEAFLDGILGRLGMRSLVAGYNFTVGRGRSGDLATLNRVGNRMGFDVTIVPPVLHQGAPVSSTRIRDALGRGRIDAANAMLGYLYVIEGRVGEGDGRGRSLGYPTANLELDDPRKLLPTDGVYAVWVKRRGEAHLGIMNLGCRPTFGGGRTCVEVHLIDFRDSLYGETLVVEVVKRLRDEETFLEDASLAEQIGRDVEIARQVLGRTSVARDHR